jgi:hypothetical protein
MQTIEIVMVAPSRVGKTSLIAAMYEYIKPAFEKTQCYIEPVGSTVNELQRLKIDLYKMFEESSHAEFRGGGISASVSPREYKFRIGKIGKSADLELVFIDLPGGFYTTDNDEIKKQVNEIIKRALVTFIPIDTAALFASNNKLNAINEEINQPSFIKSFYNDLLNNGDLMKNKLVFVTPVKCEKYNQLPNGTEEIFQKLCDDETYRSLLSLFTNEETNSAIELIFCPVETLGGIHVVRTERDKDGNPEHILKRIGSYAPRNCHLPLSYLFYYILRTVKEQKNQNPVWSWFRNLFKMNTYLEESIEVLSKGIKEARTKHEMFILQTKMPNVQNKSIKTYIP